MPPKKVNNGWDKYQLKVLDDLKTVKETNKEQWNNIDEIKVSIVNLEKNILEKLGLFRTDLAVSNNQIKWIVGLASGAVSAIVSIIVKIVGK